jgi:chemotaxis protein methyltransferase CheR
MTADAALKASPADMVEGEFAFTEADFRKIAAMLHGDAGIALPDDKATLVYSRLAKRLRALGLKSFKDYCALVAGAGGLDERQRMLAALTTNVTRFFREPHHFDHLRDEVMPTLARRARDGGRVRIWSAACSSGQEPYSAAMAVLAGLPEASGLDVRLLATDIDPNVLGEGREGVYATTLLTGIPDDLRRRWTEPWGAGRVRLADEVRDLVSFRELNLIGDWPMAGRFDAIFCRNVAIYFDDATQARLWERLAGKLAPGGVLYIGHSERVAGPAAQVLEPIGVTAYRLTGEAAR